MGRSIEDISRIFHFDQFAEPRVERLSRLPSSLYVLVGYILPDAFQQITLNEGASRIFSEVRLNSIIAFPSKAIQLGKSWQVGSSPNPEKNPVPRDWFVADECCVEVTD